MACVFNYSEWSCQLSSNKRRENRSHLEQGAAAHDLFVGGGLEADWVGAATSTSVTGCLGQMGVSTLTRARILFVVLRHSRARVNGAGVGGVR